MTTSRLMGKTLMGSVLGAALVLGCVTPQKTASTAPKKKKALVMKEKPGAKSNTETAATAPGQTPASPIETTSQSPTTVTPPPAPVISIERRQASFIQTHLTEENRAVTDEEERSVMPPNGESIPPGSLAEACAVVAISKRVVIATPTRAGGFVEQDTTQGIDKAKSPSLIDTMAQQRMIDFSHALEINAFLQNPAAQRLVLKAVEKSSDTQPFKDRVFASMRRVSDQWTSHLVSLGRAMGTAVVAVGTTPAGQPGAATDGAAATPPGNGVQPGSLPNAAQLTGNPTAQPGAPNGSVPTTNATTKDQLAAPATGSEVATNGKPAEVKPIEAGKEESALQEAQNLADAGKYQEAIAKAQGVSPQSPVHAKAQDRIRAISNRAVQELRMKAAQAFQGSLPISDPKARTAYLERARKFLEDAIKSYPQADQLNTVKENLSVITRDIERLKDEPTRR